MEKELSMIGIEHQAGNTYFIPNVGDIDIPQDSTIADVFKLIYDLGFIWGVEEGRRQKIKEIKDALNIS